ncbi:MAG: acireductone synthase [Proteobacteria bacterium]|nr:acireductone synthase [Pseudomonadota bacterium]
MIEHLLLDIEGATTPIAFVHEVLFPNARRLMPEFVEGHFDDPSCAEELGEVRRSVAEALGSAPEDVTPEQVAAQLVAWIDSDHKGSPLKSLQGRVWRAGYEAGEFRGDLFDDVAPAFHRWRAASLGVWIFSSGSVEAQELLFRHSTAGDLTPLIDGYFDTTTGAKRDADAYRRIAAAIGAEPARVLFLSDMPAELDAASEAGMSTALTLRPGNAPVAEPAHPTAVNFDELP